MAFTEGSEVIGKKLFTGLVDVSVVLVNPTLAELNAAGVNFQQEPTYTSRADEGYNKVRLDIWVNNPVTGMNKMAFFLEDVSKPSAKGNNQYINDYGQSTWAESESAATSRTDKNGNKFFKEDGVRLAKAGEPELVDFIKSLLSVPKDNKAGIDNIAKLIAGDVTELRTIFSKFTDRKVQVLFIVKQGNDGNWYQNIYARYFGRAGSKGTAYWTSHFAGNQNVPMYQNIFALKEFDPLNYSSSATSTTQDDDPWAKK